MEVEIKPSKDKKCPMPAMEWDLVPHQNILRLRQNLEELHEARISLEVKRINDDVRIMSRNVSMTEMDGNKMNLVNLFVEADKVIKDHIASKSRFVEKIEENSRELSALTEKIEKVKGDIHHFGDIKQDMDRYVEQYSAKFEHFLEKVTETSPDSPTVGNILMQFEILENCRRKSKLMLQDEIQRLEELKKEMITLVEEKSTLFKSLINSLVTLELRRTQAKTKRMYWENITKRINEQISTNLEESSILNHACHDLYETVCGKRNLHPTLPLKDTNNQLKVILKSIQLAKDVVRLATAAHQEAEESSFEPKSKETQKRKS